MIAASFLRFYPPRAHLIRLVRLLTLLALLLAPVGMSEMHGAAAMAPVAAGGPHLEAMAAGHCADMSEEESGDRSLPESDCRVACAAIPAADECLAEPPLLIAAAETLPLAARPRGLHPESDPPPPRA